MIDLRLGDCMDAMREMDDGEFDLAIVDPPYGIFTKDATGFKNNKNQKLENDKRPPDSYFRELRSVSRSQIVWGGNYFGDCLGRCIAPIIWDKQTGGNYFADGEMAWTSFPTGTLRIFRHQWCGAFQGDMKNPDIRIHPTQKPVRLYEWLLDRFAKPGFRILDTHAGSGSLAIACHKLGFDYVGFEINEKYYQAAKRRIENEMAQVRMEFT